MTRRRPGLRLLLGLLALSLAAPLARGSGELAVASPAPPSDAAAAGSAGAEQAAAAEGEPRSLAKEQYLEAINIRDKPDPSLKELKHAVRLLRESAGIERLSVVRRDTSAAAASTAGTSSAGAGGGAGGDQGQQAQQGAQQQQGQGQGRGQGGQQQNGTSGGGGRAALTAAQVELVLKNETAAYLPALKELMYVYRTGDGVSANQAVAHRLLQKLAELGDGDCQTDLGFTLALGVQPIGPNPRDQLMRFVPPDPPSALAHYYFGAAAGDSVAQMILGYRHLQGLGVPKSCQAAVLYYAPVAERVLSMAQAREGLPQIRNLRLSHKTAHVRQRSTEQEVLHYQWFADFGNVDAARAVAHMLTHGSMRDYEQAIYYLKQAAAAGDSDAMAHLGHIYANGIAVEQNNETALAWFWKAADKGHPSGMFGLGYMHLQGQGVTRSHSKALKYFKQAAESQPGLWAGQGDAFFYLGLMHLNGWATKPDQARAVQLFDVAAKAGNLLAAYNLATLHLRGATSDRSPCEAAAALLKRVAEKGFPVLQEAHEDFQRGEYEWALLGYLKAAEMGMELGQSNAAWMLTEGYGYEGPGAGPVALQLYRRAAEQGNTDALLRLGDGYWYGKGVGRDWARAAQMYNEAGKHKIGQALFNLGYMHEYGAGLPQDFHLAKRFYDRALEAQPEGKLAVQVALAGLRLHTWWLGFEPRLPRSWAWLWAGLFTHAPESAYPLHAHHAGAAHRTAWDRLRDALTLDVLFEKLDAVLDFEEGLDVTVIGGLAALLLLVMWRRQTLRARQARFFPEAPPGAPLQPQPEPQWQQQGAAEPVAAPAPAQQGAAAVGQQPPRPQEEEEGEAQVQGGAPAAGQAAGRRPQPERQDHAGEAPQ